MTEYDLGVEKEYALIGRTEGLVGYCLGVEHVLDALRAPSVLPEEHKQGLEELQNNGWYLEPEYSRCLVEVVSPPASPEESLQIIDGYRLFEESLAIATRWVHEQIAPNFESIEIGDGFGSMTNKFFNVRAEPVEDWSSILLPTKKSKNIVQLAREKESDIPEIHGSPEAASRIFAGFTSTHITVRRFGFYDACGSPLMVEKDIAQALWATLKIALQANERIRTDKLFYPDGSGAVECNPSPREVFLKWMDHLGEKMKNGAKAEAALHSDEALALFREIYGDGPFTDDVFDEKRFRNYACRPRIVNGNLMFEFRCFDGAMSADTACKTAEEIASVWRLGV